MLNGVFIHGDDSNCWKGTAAQESWLAANNFQLYAS